MNSSPIPVLILCLTAAALASEPRFVDVSHQSGLDFTNVSGGADKHYIIETQSAGGGFWDYDGDGHLDIFLTNGSLIDAPEGTPLPTTALFRGRGDGTFADISQQSGAQLRGWNMGFATADYDGDGDSDLYVTRWGPDAFLRNRGDGTLEEATAQARLGQTGWGIGAAWADYDLDGDLDLYVANYIEFKLHGPPFYDRWCVHNGLPAACGPSGFPARAGVLYRNEGNGTFADVSQQSGIAAQRFYGMGAAWADMDKDGDQDLYVANDGQPNSLLRNDGGTFVDIALMAGVAYSGDGRPQAGMGVALSDFDDDGHTDIFVTNFSQDHNTLYHNQGNGFFADISGRAGLAGSSRPFMGWSTFFFDYDHDGYQDLFVANGHLMPAIERAGVGLTYKERNQLYRSQGDGTFAEVAPEGALAIAEVSRGAACGDYDQDGDLDILVANLDARPTLMRNEGGNSRHWLMLRLQGEGRNREAFGARVRLVAGGREQFRELSSGIGFQSQNDLRLHFGLGASERAELVEIRWPDGHQQVFRAVAADHHYLVRKSADRLIPE